jgi:multidrug resistance efflux pump
MKIKFNRSPSSPNENNILKVNYAPSKRPISKWRFRTVLILFLLPFVAFGGYLIYRTVYNLLFVNAPGFLVVNQITVKAPYDGEVEFIKRPGESVSKGEIIVRIKNQVIENQYYELSSNLQQQVKPSTDQRPSSELLNTAKELYENRLKTYREILSLKDKGAATNAEVSNALSQLNSAKMSYLELKSSSEKSNISYTPPISDNVRLNELKSILESLVIRAPQSGIVASSFVNEGEWISKGSDLVLIQDDNNIRIKAFLDPNKSKYIVLNKKVRVILPNGQSIEAKIVSFNSQTQRTPADLISPFEKDKLSLVVDLEPIESIPENLRVNYLPVKVIF